MYKWLSSAGTDDNMLDVSLPRTWPWLEPGEATNNLCTGLWLSHQEVGEQGAERCKADVVRRPTA
jgi:hypothetical protein